jgi:hypothetical protein
LSSSSNRLGGGQDLINLLIEKRVITPAQAELARSQCAVAGVTAGEFLLKNGWVSEATLRQLAPWIFREQGGEKQRQDTVETNESLLANTTGSCDDYEKNLARYRAILKDILGPDGP